ncbi:MAG: hypothetical protein D6732_10260 [Methanobacteriota archaeon]|nr:MAG: hypothetical protein D6732_10260 [Euryarchaeota archaeon]
MLVFLFSSHLWGLNTVSGQIALNQRETFNYYIYSSSIDMSSVDGSINPNEYPETNSLTSVDGFNFVDVSFIHNSTHLKIGIRSKLFGWVGFGFGDNGMLNSTLVTTGAEGTTPFQPSVWRGIGNQFPSFLMFLEDFNGSVAVNEDATGTTVEFLLPLNGTAHGGNYNWQVGGTYGFFMAAHNSSDQLTYHTYHTPRNLKATLLPSNIPLPQTVSIDSFTVSKIEDETYLLKATVKNAPAGTEVEFRMVTNFGGVVLGTNTTDGNGVAELVVDLSIATFEERELVAIIYPQQGFTGATKSTIVNGLNDRFEEIYVHNIVADPEFDDPERFLINPDLFNNSGHLIGAVFIYLLMLIITMLIWEYVAAIMKLAYISFVGKRMEETED